MNAKAINFIKNFSYTFTSNLLSLFVSTLVVLIVPKLIGVEEYGYWQLYLFYAAYVGFLHFGWSDGIYLREGGKDYKTLNHKKLYSQFYMLFFMQFIIAVIIIGLGLNYLEDENRIFIIQMTALCMLVTNIRSMPLFLLQATNRIKEYAKATIIGQVFYFLLMLSTLVAGVRNFKVLIAADLLGRIVSLLYSVHTCKEIIIRPIYEFFFSIRETWENIYVGSKLMFSYIASLLIIGVVRLGIERTWDVATFGKVSLTLSVSKLVMLFINSIGIILFPVLRKIDAKKLPSIYSTMRDILMAILLGLLTVYYPFRTVLTAWLPNYSDSLAYMAMLFPMIVFEGKMCLLINTYLKTLRKEGILLRINIISLLMSTIITLLTTTILGKLELAVASIVIILAVRSILAEIWLSKELDIKVNKDIVLEVIMTIVFITTSWYINAWTSTLIYSIFFLLYINIKSKELKSSIVNTKEFGSINRKAVQ